MQKLLNFFQDSYFEVSREVTWTKTDKLNQSTVIVIIGTIIFALVIGFIDSIYKVGLESIYSLFK